jgi:hypothetical protein
MAFGISESVKLLGEKEEEKDLSGEFLDDDAIAKVKFFN